jgi:hypothetical protein
MNHMLKLEKRRSTTTGTQAHKTIGHTTNNTHDQVINDL